MEQLSDLLRQAWAEGVGFGPETVLLLNLIVGAAAVVSSLTGFGYALVATPFLVLLFPPRVVVPTVMVGFMPLAALLVWEARRQMQWRRIGLWLAGSLAGVPLGVYALAAADPDAMRMLIGAVTLLAALTLWLKPARPLRAEKLWAPAVGALSGAMGGATGMSGPPVVLFGLNQGWPAAALRANLIGYFAAKHLVNLGFMAGFGILNAGTLALGVAALPGMAAGYFGGIRLKAGLSDRHVRPLAFGLVLARGDLAELR